VVLSSFFGWLRRSETGGGGHRSSPPRRSGVGARFADGIDGGLGGGFVRYLASIRTRTEMRYDELMGGFPRLDEDKHAQYVRAGSNKRRRTVHTLCARW
jgi:hypothetical protein